MLCETFSCLPSQIMEEDAEIIEGMLLARMARQAWVQKQANTEHVSAAQWDLLGRLHEARKD